MYLLSFVTATADTSLKCSPKTVSCVFSKKFHILIVLSDEPEMMYLLSIVTATVETLELCPCKTLSCLFSKTFHILILLSLEPVIT